MITYLDKTAGSPVYTGGARAGAVGVSAPPLSFLGNPTQRDVPPAGLKDTPQIGQAVTLKDNGAWYLVLADNSVHSFDLYKRVSGAWVFVHSLRSLQCLGEGGTQPGVGESVNSPETALVAYDSLRHQLHLGAFNQAAVGTLIGVWSASGIEAAFAGFTVANRLRSYGTAALSGGGPGVLVNPFALTLGGPAYEFATLVATGADRRIHVYDHTVPGGQLLLDEAQGAPYNGTVFAAGRWFGGCGSASGSEPGVHELDIPTAIASKPAAAGGLGRLDVDNTFTAARFRRLQFRAWSSAASYRGLLVVRTTNRYLGWDAATGAWVDEFGWAGGASDSPPEHYGAHPGQGGIPEACSGKFLFFETDDPNDCDELLALAGNTDNDLTQSHYVVTPASTSTVTWAQTFAESATVTGLFLLGKQTSGGRTRLEYQVDAGPWVTLAEDATLPALSIPAGGVLRVRLSMSSFYRLDNHPRLKACREKLPPTECRVAVITDAASPPPPTGQTFDVLPGSVLILAPRP